MAVGAVTLAWACTSDWDLKDLCEELAHKSECGGGAYCVLVSCGPEMPGPCEEGDAYALARPETLTDAKEDCGGRAWFEVWADQCGAWETDTGLDEPRYNDEGDPPRWDVLVACYTTAEG